MGTILTEGFLRSSQLQLIQDEKELQSYDMKMSSLKMFSHFEEPEGSATAMFHRLTSGMSCKQLYIQFLWQLCLFLLTLNVSASLFQAIERQHVESTNEGVSGTQRDLILNFSKTYNVSADLVDQLLIDLRKNSEASETKPPRYLDALILALSTFFTIGWGHVIPKSDGGKMFCCISSLIGIPLTFLVVSTGAKVLIRHLQDLIRVTQTNYTKKRNKYGDTKINTRTRSMLIPCLITMLLLYWFISSIAVMKIENISYVSALYFSFCTFSTIGFGDYVLNNMLTETDLGKVFGHTLFCFVWIFFGITLVAANIMTFYLYQKKPMRLGKQQKKKQLNDSKRLALLESNT